MSRSLTAAREWRRQHPSRLRELIVEGIARRERQIPGDNRRRARQARAAQIAAGFNAGPSTQTLSQAQRLLSLGLSQIRVAYVLGYSPNRVSVWRTKGWL